LSLDGTGIQVGYCYQIREVYHGYHSQQEVHYHGRRGEDRWDRWDHHHFRQQQKAYGMCWDVECIGRQASCIAMEYDVRMFDGGMGGGIGGAAGVMGAAGSIGVTVSALGGRLGAAASEVTWIAVGDTTGSGGAVLVTTSDVVDALDGVGTGTLAGG
jgi:hypothetical protein